MWKNVRLLFSKELLGAVRDRRTLILTVFFPLIFYPLILSVMGRFNEAERVRLETLTPAVILVDQSDDATFESELQKSNAFYWLGEDSVESAVDALRNEQGNLVMAWLYPRNRVAQVSDWQSPSITINRINSPMPRQNRCAASSRPI